MKRLSFIISLLLSSVLFLNAAPKNDYLVTITTPVGEMKIILYENTPEHKKQFIELIQSGYFTNKPIYRVIDELGIHFGDGKDMDNLVKDERFNAHKKGVLASLRIKDDENPDKASSLGQFYIVNTDKKLSFLNNAYTVFGEIIVGLEILDKLSQTTVDDDYKPTSPMKFSISVEEMKSKKITKTTGYTYP